MYYVIGVPIILLLSIGFGFLMAKKMESIGAGKVMAALGFTMLMILLLLIRFLMNNT